MKKNLTKSLLSVASVFLVGFSPVVASPFIHAQESTTQESTGEEATEGNLIVEYIKADAKEIKGTTPAGATITVLNERTSDKETVDADAEGNFVIPTKEFEIKENDVLNFTANTKENQMLTRTVKVESIAKELQESTTTTVAQATTKKEAQPIVVSEPIKFVTDLQGNHTLVVDAIKAGDKTVKGTTFPEGVVTLLVVKTGEKVTVDADKEGKFEIKLPESSELISGDQLHLTSLSKDIQTLDYIEVTVK